MGEGPGVHLSNASDYWHDDLWVVDTETLESRQISLRNSRRLATAMRSSRLPGLKTLADFDFSFQPSIRREQIDSLHELGFLERKENVAFLGPPDPVTYCTTFLCACGIDS